MRKELSALRESMEKHGVDCYIVPTNDFHGSEYLNDFFKTRQYVSGFTGSAGTLIVTKSSAKLWTDGRYFLQAALQLEGSGITLMKIGEPGIPTVEEYLETALSPDSVLGFDGLVVSANQGMRYAEIAHARNSKVKSDFDLVGEIWENRPILKGNSIWQLPLYSSGLPFATKLEQVRDLMSKAGSTHLLITDLAANAWLYNFRGSDIKHTPVFFSFTLITPEKVILYAFLDAISPEIVPPGVEVVNYTSVNPDGSEFLTVAEDLANLPAGSVIQLNMNVASYTLVDAISDEARVLDGPSPISLLKASKNPVEIESTAKTHIDDGVAMVKFIYWLKKNIGIKPITEISASDYLEGERRKLDGFIDLSFETIAGYGPHGAIVHYGATPESNIPLEPQGFFLVDSGGQYLTGTTDITRTIALGPLTEKMKKYYTAVLRGHIDLAMARFTEKTKGIELDLIARAPLTEQGLDYNHGTGHGVGHVLGVHEGPNSISKRGESTFVPGMITSDEPGVYLEGEFGIRIEGELLCVKEEDSPEYSFRMLTCCPYEPEAILVKDLTPEEKAWLNDYHAWVRETLAPHLAPEEARWLESVTREL